MSSDKRNQASNTTTHGRTDSQGKVFAPDSPVDVPRMPPKHDAAPAATTEASRPTAPLPDAVADENASDSEPVKIDTTQANWADSTQPAPDKRTARSSIL